MNQQRSRRFRAAQEAKDKEEAHKESIQLWEGDYYAVHIQSTLYSICVAMGKTVSEDEKNKKSWDSNAITPGTPFMDLLATSLRYWVVQKSNTDSGWKNVSMIAFSIRSKRPHSLFCRSKSLFQTRAFPERGSTKLWTILGDSALILDMIPTLVT